jgi:ubiquitin carboxyl-terminal hydrolase 10
VPWYSRPDVDFPPRAKHNRRRAKTPLSSGSRVVLPQRENQQEESIEQETAPGSRIPPSLDSETDGTSQAPSETDSTQPTTPSSAVTPTRVPQTPTLHKPSRSIIPAVPILPILPQSPTASKRGHRDSTVSATSKSTATQGPLSPTSRETAINQPQIPVEDASSTPAPAPAPAPPKSWADLVRSKIPANSVPVFGGMGPTNGHGSSKNEQLANVLNAIGADPVQEVGKIAFIEPRGLVNTGNMCYMNSVRRVNPPSKTQDL